MGEHLWNAAVAAGPYALCLLFAGLAIWGLDWTVRGYAEMARAAEERERRIRAAEQLSHGDVIELPAAARKGAGGAAQKARGDRNALGTSLTHSEGGK